MLLFSRLLLLNTCIKATELNQSITPKKNEKSKEKVCNWKTVARTQHIKRWGKLNGPLRIDRECYIAKVFSKYFDHVHTSIDWLLSYKCFICRYCLSVFYRAQCTTCCVYLLSEPCAMQNNCLYWIELNELNEIRHNHFITLLCSFVISLSFIHSLLFLLIHFDFNFFCPSQVQYAKIYLFLKMCEGHLLLFYDGFYYTSWITILTLHWLINRFIFKRKRSDILCQKNENTHTHLLARSLVLLD